MIITIKIHTCADADADGDEANVTGKPPRLVVAYGYLPSGQLLIQSGKAVPRADYQIAIRSVVGWIFRHRPGWSFEIDDARTSHVEVAP